MTRFYLTAFAASAMWLGLGSAPASADPYPGYGYTQQYNVDCSSINYQPRYCPVNGYVVNAYLAYQMSNNRGPCIPGRTWGYDSRGLWVNSGCRGIFTVYVTSGYPGGGGYPGYPGRPGPGRPGYPGHGPGGPGRGPGHGGPHHPNSVDSGDDLNPSDLPDLTELPESLDSTQPSEE